MVLSDQFVPARLFLRTHQLHTDLFSDDFPEGFPNQIPSENEGKSSDFARYGMAVIRNALVSNADGKLKR